MKFHISIHNTYNKYACKWLQINFVLSDNTVLTDYGVHMEFLQVLFVFILAWI